MASDPQSSAALPSLIAKVAGGLFGLFVAPVIVAVGSNYLQKKIETQIEPAPAKVTAGKPESAQKSRPSPGPILSPRPTPVPAPHPRPRPSPAVSENPATGPKLARRETNKSLSTQTIHLLNGNDLKRFSTYLGIPHDETRPYGKNNDPERAFAVEYRDLHVSGKVSGILETEEDYENYTLTVEYRFGRKTWPPREGAPKVSGVLLHAKPPPDESPTQWRLGYRVMISEDSAGSIALPPASQDLSLTVEADRAAPGPKGKAGRARYRYQPGSTPLTLTKGTIDRLGYTKGQAAKDPGPEIKSQAGWNILECVCAGDQLTVKLNGKVVNAATRLSVSKGKVGIISDGAEIMFRTIDLKPLPPSRVRGG